MKDDARSPVQHALVLHGIAPDHRLARFYSLMIERDLFGTITLVRTWGGSATMGGNWCRSSRPSWRLVRRLRRWPKPSGGEATGICKDGALRHREDNGYQVRPSSPHTATMTRTAAPRRVT